MHGRIMAHNGGFGELAGAGERLLQTAQAMLRSVLVRAGQDLPSGTLEAAETCPGGEEPGRAVVAAGFGGFLPHGGGALDEYALQVAAPARTRPKYGSPRANSPSPAPTGSTTWPAAGMSISGIRTAYDGDEVTRVAEITGLEPRRRSAP